MAKFVIKLPKPLLDEEWPFYHTFYTVVLGVRATKMSDGLAPPPKNHHRRFWLNVFNLPVTSMQLISSKPCNKFTLVSKLILVG